MTPIAKKTRQAGSGVGQPGTLQQLLQETRRMRRSGKGISSDVSENCQSNSSAVCENYLKRNIGVKCPWTAR